MAKIIGSAESGPFVGAVLLEADDGLAAVELLRSEKAVGRQVHFVLMDFVMVIKPIFDKLFGYSL